MNYYERHIGDYLKDTAHLSLLEHGIYTRLLDVYYTRESAIPDDQVARLIGARTKDEKDALQAVLVEFFTKTDAGWAQDRCDREIERYRDGEPEREIKKANESNRVKRHRDERANLFKALTDAGQHAPWNIGIVELREMVKRLGFNGPDTQTVTVSDTKPVTAPVTPATATHTPLPNTQTPDTSSQGIQGATAPLSPAQPATVKAPALELTGNPGQPVPSIPPCPVKQLIGLFVAKAPELPKPRPELWLESKGADAMRKRWKWLLSADAVREDGSRYATTAAEAIEWFGLFFDKVNESDFLSGRNGAWKNCDLTWLMNRENFMKVVQGNYENKVAA